MGGGGGWRGAAGVGLLLLPCPAATPWPGLAPTLPPYLQAPLLQSTGTSFKKLNWLKAGILACDKLLTVSPNYATGERRLGCCVGLAGHVQGPLAGVRPPRLC